MPSMNLGTKALAELLSDRDRTSEEILTQLDHVSKSKSDSYIFIGSFSTLTSEYRFLDASKPFGDFKLVQI